MKIEDMKDAIQARLGRKIDAAVWFWFAEIDGTWEFEAIEFLVQVFEDREAEIKLILANAAMDEPVEAGNE
jgi:hypothetical protein